MTNDQNSQTISTDNTENADIEYQNKLPVENKSFGPKLIIQHMCRTVKNTPFKVLLF